MKLKNVFPFGNRIMVQQFEADQKVGSLYVPNTAEKKPSQGKVIAVGSGRILDNGEVLPIRLDVGQIVVFTKFSGTPVNTTEGEFLIMEADNVLAVSDIEEV